MDPSMAYSKDSNSLLGKIPGRAPFFSYPSIKQTYRALTSAMLVANPKVLLCWFYESVTVILYASQQVGA